MKNNLVKILATLGLIVAIALILRGVFDVGKIGIKNFSSKLPILKCEIYDTDGSKKIQFYDLEKIKNEDPTNEMTQDQFQKWRKQKNLDSVTFGDSKGMNNYTITYRYHENGVDKGYNIAINKDTGELEARFPKHISVDATFDEILDAFAEGKLFKGECIEVKRKNL